MLQLSVAHRAKLRWIFLGPKGIRAGWSLVIFVALMIPLELIGGILKRNYPSLFVGDIAPGKSLVIEALGLFYIVGAIAITGRIEGRAVWSYYGLAGQRPIAKLLAGWTGGLGCLSLVVGVLYAGGFLALDGWALHGLSILGYGLSWLLVFLLVSLLGSVLFGAGHIPNAGETVVGITGVMIRALLYCFLLRLTGSLWLGIGFHAAWDWAQSFLYGTPQSGHLMQGHLFSTHPLGAPLMSGGSVGPEGSLLWAPPFVLGLLVFLWALRRAGLFVAAQQALGPPVRAVSS